MTFITNDVSDLSGDFNWIKPTQPKAKIYTPAFQIETTAVGSQYVPPVQGAQVLNVTNAILTLVNSNAGPVITNHVILSAKNKVTNDPTLSTNKLTFSLTVSSGLFSGKVADPQNGLPYQFKGVLFQKQNAGFGYFLNPTQSAPVYFGP